MKKIFIYLIASFIGLSCSNQVNNSPEIDSQMEDTLSISTEDVSLTDTLAPYFSGKNRVLIKNILIDNEEFGFCIYFKIVNGVAKSPKMYIKYDEHDVYQFSVNGEKYTYKANYSKGSGENKISWYDFDLQYNDVRLINALIKADNARIVFSDGTSVPVTNEMMVALRRTLDYYKALGGELPTSIL